MKKAILLLIFLLIFLVPTSQALFGFDEFLDDDPQLIQETVEEENGNVCTNCITSIRINYPNGSLYGQFNMSFNSTASKYQQVLNLTLVNGNTTIYSVTINSNRTTNGQIRNGTSDRTQITIYDIFPNVDSQWDVGLVLMFIVIQYVFLFMAYRFHDEHIMVKYAFFAIALALNGVLLGLGQRILVINGVTTTKFVNMIDSAEVIAIWLIWIFTAYIFLHLILYLINTVLDRTNELSARISRRGKD